jgi:hypothetical protein
MNEGFHLVSSVNFLDRRTVVKLTEKLGHYGRYYLLRLKQRAAQLRRPEIRLGDFFGASLAHVVGQRRPKKILEIGAWDGTGSTTCLLRRTYYKPEFMHCVELNAERAKVIQQQIVPQFPFVQVHNCSTINYAQWSFKDFEADFWNILTPEQRQRLDRAEWYGYWEREGKLLQANKAPTYFEQYPDMHYDMVLIDGGEFTGEDEFRLLNYRFNIIALDDVFRAFKCMRIYDQLSNHPDFELLTASRMVRNGYAIFARK